MFEILRKIVHKHLGLEDIVNRVLERIGDVEKITLIGDYARGLDTGKIEIVLQGKNLNTEYIDRIEEKIEPIIERKVTFFLTNKMIKDQDVIILYESEISKN